VKPRDARHFCNNNSSSQHIRYNYIWLYVYKKANISNGRISGYDISIGNSQLGMRLNFLHHNYKKIHGSIPTFDTVDQNSEPNSNIVVDSRSHWVTYLGKNVARNFTMVIKSN